jgi:hypothetical protein
MSSQRRDVRQHQESNKERKQDSEAHCDLDRILSQLNGNNMTMKKAPSCEGHGFKTQDIDHRIQSTGMICYQENTHTNFPLKMKNTTAGSNRKRKQASRTARLTTNLVFQSNDIIGAR